MIEIMTHDVELKDHYKEIKIESNLDLESNDPIITRMNNQIDIINEIKPLKEIKIVLTGPTTVTMDLTFADGKEWNSVFTITPNTGEFTTGVPSLLPERVIIPVTNFTRTLTQEAFAGLQYTKIEVNYF